MKTSRNVDFYGEHGYTVTHVAVIAAERQDVRLPYLLAEESLQYRVGPAVGQAGLAGAAQCLRRQLAKLEPIKG